MAWLNRRVLLTLALCGGAISLSAASWLRKPPVYSVLRPVVEPVTTELRGLGGLVLTEPAKPLPELAFQDGQGGRHTLADFRGRPVVLNLWATWCQPCVAELPSLAALARAEAPDGIAVVALSIDRGGVAAVTKFLAAHAIDLPVQVDPEGASGRALGARGLPTTLVLDRAGLERARFEGAADWASPAARARVLAVAGG